MFVVPWLILRINERVKTKRGASSSRVSQIFDYSSETFKPIGNYGLLMGTATLARLLLMFVLNTLLFAPLYLWLFSERGTFDTVFTNPTLFLTLGGGYALWNVVQGVTEAVIAYLIVYPTTLYKRFATW